MGPIGAGGVILPQNLKDFWQRFQYGIEVAVGGDLPDKLLGVREGFLRYFHDGLEQSVPVSVSPRTQDEPRPTPLPLSDEEIVQMAQRRARKLEEEHPGLFTFYVGSEAGLATVRAGDQTRHLVRSWTVVRGLGDEAWGSSGSVQLPQSLIQGLDDAELPFAVPGRRRSGGMVSSLTGGVETRKSATALATFHAISTLMYGLLESRPRFRRRVP